MWRRKYDVGGRRVVGRCRCPPCDAGGRGERWPPGVFFRGAGSFIKRDPRAPKDPERTLRNSSGRQRISCFDQRRALQHLCLLALLRPQSLPALLRPQSPLALLVALLQPQSPLALLQPRRPQQYGLRRRLHGESSASESSSLARARARNMERSRRSAPSTRATSIRAAKRKSASLAQAQKVSGMLCRGPRRDVRCGARAQGNGNTFSFGNRSWGHRCRTRPSLRA